MGQGEERATVGAERVRNGADKREMEKIGVAFYYTVVLITHPFVAIKVKFTSHFTVKRIQNSCTQLSLNVYFFLQPK